MLLKYQPYRIIQKFCINVSSFKELALKYPNAVCTKHPFNAVGEYMPGAVIDSPTIFEIQLFNASTRLAVKIPQKDGFDDPMSGLARSRKVSRQGKMKYMRTVDLTVVESPVEKPEVKTEENKSPTKHSKVKKSSKKEPTSITDIQDNTTELTKSEKAGENNE